MLEIEPAGSGLTRWPRVEPPGINAGLALRMGVRFRIRRVPGFVELDYDQFQFKSEKRKFLAWVAHDARPSDLRKVGVI